MTYTTINACTHPPSKEQIITIIIYIIQLTLHSIFVLPGLISMNYDPHKSILYFLLVLFYVLLVLIIYDFVWISVHDPVDRIIVDPDRAQIYSEDELDSCSQCGKKRYTSYHCNRCGRCTEEFDHHCKFLNNCIGLQNYENFLRLLIANIAYHLVCIAQTAWVFVLSKNNEIKVLWEGGHIIIFVISGILIIFISVLLGFHCYISCCVNMTTLDWIFYDSEELEDRKSRQSRLSHMRNLETERSFQKK